MYPANLSEIFGVMSRRFFGTLCRKIHVGLSRGYPEGNVGVFSESFFFKKSLEDFFKRNTYR